MGAMDERELFTHDFERRSTDELWAAVKRGLATWDLKDADDASATARFDTSDWTWSWGEHLLAQVEEGDGGSARLVVRGRPKRRLLTTKWGEDQHAKKVEKELIKSVEGALEDRSA